MVNREKIEEAIRLLLEGIGEDADREGLRETPGRVARMYEELLAGMEADAGALLFHLRASSDALFRKSAYCLYS